MAAADQRGEAAWLAQWRKALAESAGQAPYLDDGVAYVEGIRSADVERLQIGARLTQVSKAPDSRF